MIQIHLIGEDHDVRAVGPCIARGQCHSVVEAAAGLRVQILCKQLGRLRPLISDNYPAEPVPIQFKQFALFSRVTRKVRLVTLLHHSRDICRTQQDDLQPHRVDCTPVHPLASPGIIPHDPRPPHQLSVDMLAGPGPIPDNQPTSGSNSQVFPEGCCIGRVLWDGSPLANDRTILLLQHPGQGCLPGLLGPIQSDEQPLHLPPGRRGGGFLLSAPHSHLPSSARRPLRPRRPVPSPGSEGRSTHSRPPSPHRSASQSTQPPRCKRPTQCQRTGGTHR